MKIPKVYLVIVAVAAVFVAYRCFVVYRAYRAANLPIAEIAAEVKAARPTPSPIPETYTDVTRRLVLPYDAALFDFTVKEDGRKSKAIFQSKNARTQNNFLMVLASLWPEGMGMDSAENMSRSVSDVLAQYGFAFSNYMDPIGACTVAQSLKDSGTPDELSAIAITGVNKQGACVVYLFSDKLDTDARVKTYALYIDAFVAMKNAP